MASGAAGSEQAAIHGVDKDLAEFRKSLGQRIRVLRTNEGLSLNDLAGMADISQPFLSQIETGRHMPSVITLHRIATVLNAKAQDLLEDADLDPDGPLGEAGSQVSRSEFGNRHELAPGSAIRFLTVGRLRMQPNEVVALPGSVSGEPTVHAGEEFVYVAVGNLEVSVGDATEVLTAGDSIYYQASVPHSWRCLGKEPVRFLISSSPGSF